LRTCWLGLGRLLGLLLDFLLAGSAFGTLAFDQPGRRAFLILIGIVLAVEGLQEELSTWQIVDKPSVMPAPNSLVPGGTSCGMRVSAPVMVASLMSLERGLAIFPPAQAWGHPSACRDPQHRRR
jgi:hypothetical protein